MKKTWSIIGLCSAIICAISAVTLVIVYFDAIRRGVGKCRAAANRRKYIGSADDPAQATP